MSKRILITGGAGFIGCEVGAAFGSDGHDVVALDNLHPQIHPLPGLPKRMATSVRFVPGDVTSAGNLDTLFKYFLPDVVLHLAAETGTGQSLTEAGRHASVNVAGTAQLLDALTRAQHVPEHLMLASSRAVYGDGAWQDDAGTVFYPTGRSHAQLAEGRWDFSGPTGLCARALPHEATTTQVHPVSVYGATKLCQEHVLAAWCRAFATRLSILRLQNVYGPGQAPNNSYTGILTLFVKLAREGRVIDVYEDGAIIRDFVHVSDVARAFVLALHRPHAGLRVLDIGSGDSTTVATVARMIASKLGAPEPVISGRFRDGDVRAASCSIDAARELLGYEPTVALGDGLASIVG
jgi:dTDP-L-rhamnose 4-epimerase